MDFEKKSDDSNGNFIIFITWGKKYKRNFSLSLNHFVKILIFIPFWFFFTWLWMYILDWVIFIHRLSGFRCFFCWCVCIVYSVVSNKSSHFYQIEFLYYFVLKFVYVMYFFIDWLNLIDWQRLWITNSIISKKKILSFQLFSIHPLWQFRIVNAYIIISN